MAGEIAKKNNEIWPLLPNSQDFSKKYLFVRQQQNNPNFRSTIEQSLLTNPKTKPLLEKIKIQKKEENKRKENNKNNTATTPQNHTKALFNFKPVVLNGKAVKGESVAVNYTYSKPKTIETKRIGQKEALKRIHNLFQKLPNEILLPPSIQKFKTTNNLANFTKDEIRTLQRIIGLYGNDRDGFLGKTTYNYTYHYIKNLLHTYNKKKKEQEKQKEIQKTKQEAKERQGKLQKWEEKQEQKIIRENKTWNIPQQQNNPWIYFSWWISQFDEKIKKENIENNKEKNWTKEKLTSETVPQIKQEILKSYNISQSTKETIDGAKDIAGESKAMKNAKQNLITTISQQKIIQRKIETLNQNIVRYEKNIQHITNPIEKQTLEQIIQTKQQEKTQYEKQREQIKQNTALKKQELHEKQLIYLRKVKEWLQDIKTQLKEQHTNEELDILREKYEFFKAIERSQRMLVGIDNTPNIYGFYTNSEGIILRKSAEWSLNPESDLQQGFYDTDEFWRIIYFNHTSEKTKPEIFHGFKAGKEPNQNGYTTTEIIKNQKKEIQWEYNRTIEQRTDSPQKHIRKNNNKNTITEAQDNKINTTTDSSIL